MIDISKIANGLRKQEGIWYKQKEIENISYTEEGNKLCFDVEENSFWFRHRNNIIEAVLANFSPEGVLFDIGGGNGFVTKRMETAGYPAVLIEPGKDGVKNARERGMKYIINASLDKDVFIPESLDNACLFDVLEHIGQAEEFLHTLYGLLKPGGRLYLTVPAYRFLWSGEDVIAGHFTRYTRKSLKKIILKSGFNIEFSSYFFSVLIFPVWLFRALPSRFKSKKNRNSLKPDMSDHKTPDGMINKILNKIWQWEVNRISTGKKILAGSSIIMVCTKDN